MHKYILKHGKHENECEHMFCLMCDGDLVYYTSCMNKQICLQLQGWVYSRVQDQGNSQNLVFLLVKSINLDPTNL